MFAMALMSMLDTDDEDEELKAIYGAGSKDFRENKMREKQRPKNTMRIGEKNIPMDVFGPLSLRLRFEANKMDRERYNGNAASESSLEFWINVTNDLYLEKISQAVGAARTYFRNDDSRRLESFWQKEGAELLSRTILPFTAASRQAEQLRDPSRKATPEFMDQLYKQSGIYLGWKNDKFAVDYRGRKVDVGSAFTSSADGFRKMISDAPKLDKADNLVLKYSPRMTQLSSTDEDLMIANRDYIYEPMGKVDYSAFMENVGKKLDVALTAWAATDPETLPRDITPMTLGQREEYYRQAQEELKTTDEAAINKRVLEINLMEKREAKIKDELSEIKKLSEDAAIEEYYLSRGLRVPYDILGAKVRYDSKMLILNAMKK